MPRSFSAHSRRRVKPSLSDEVQKVESTSSGEREGSSEDSEEEDDYSDTSSKSSADDDANAEAEAKDGKAKDSLQYVDAKLPAAGSGEGQAYDEEEAEDPLDEENECSATTAATSGAVGAKEAKEPLEHKNEKVATAAGEAQLENGKEKRPVEARASLQQVRGPAAL
jgi:hypothetical protein